MKPYYLFTRVQLGEAPLVKTAASVFQELCYNYRDQLMAGIICAGWDKRHGGQVIVPNKKFLEFSDLIVYFVEGFQHTTWRNVCETAICYWWFRLDLRLWFC